MKKSAHPYHYSEDKNIVQKVVDFGVPLGLFLVYFQLYNFGKITPSEMVKTTGLMAIFLLSLTLVIGPLCRFFPFLNDLKAHRKVWGILSFLFAFIHMSLIFIFFYKFNLLKFVDFSNPRYPGILAGILSLIILFVVTITSTKKALTTLSPQVWKALQTTAYLALTLAVIHFYLIESKDGVLVIQKLLGQITFGFAGFAVFLRLVVSFIPVKK
ncbi:MAG: ferric reductase-like transmembrane domain-containing protein [Candidatus Daviesbacteria bacterium]|nr:ferric reductase-like transmembrane domain-containing protein [Candidatus Daviesbacteria bacterium]